MGHLILMGSRQFVHATWFFLVLFGFKKVFFWQIKTNFQRVTFFDFFADNASKTPNAL